MTTSARRDDPGTPYHLMIIGAGPAGLAAANAAARRGARVALIERDLLGGTCLNAGCIPSKALIRTSRLYREVREAAHFARTGPGRRHRRLPRRHGSRASHSGAPERTSRRGEAGRDRCRPLLRRGAFRWPRFAGSWRPRHGLRESARRDRCAARATPDPRPRGSRVFDLRKRVRPD